MYDDEEYLSKNNLKMNTVGMSSSDKQNHLQTIVETILTETTEDYDGQTYTRATLHAPQHAINMSGVVTATPVQLVGKPIDVRDIRIEGYTVTTQEEAEMEHMVDGMKGKKRTYKHPEGFPCDMCPYRAKMKSHLRAHRQSVHEGIKYPCDQCEYKATAMGSLRRHYNAIHSGLKYPCSECDHVSNTAANLKYHHNTVHMGLRFPCNHCDYKATTSSHLKKHKESVHEGIKYKCNECEHESTTKESLKVHKRSLHKKILFPCPHCDYVAKVNSHLKQHVRSVHDKIRFPCDKCDYSAINNSRLKHHKETMHSGLKFTCDQHSVAITTAKQLRQIMREDVKFECSDCAIVAKTAIDILKKQKGTKASDFDDDDDFDDWEPEIKKEKSSHKIQCEICNHEARNPAELKQHIMAIHEGVTHSCDFCDFSTTHPSSLKRHKQTVHPYADLKYTCDDCAKPDHQIFPKLEDQEELKELLEDARLSDCEACKDISKRSMELLKFREENNKLGINGSPQLRWTCDECAYEGKNGGDLRHHKLSVHQGITYPCDQCEYVAVRPEALKRHKKGKHEEKKFVCDQCQFRAHSSIKLSQHKLSAHVGVRYPCNMCDFTAPKQNKLKEHKIAAHNGASFPCDECEKVFPLPKSLKDHQATVHGKGPKFQCEQCGFSTTEVDSLQVHIDTIHKGSRFDCDNCDFSSLSPEELKAHISNEHQPHLSNELNQATFLCDHCQFTCSSEVERSAHVEAAHRVQPQFACAKCDFKATGPEYLKLHVAREHQEAKFPCAECNFVSISEEALMQHKATSHEAEGFPCDLSNHQAGDRGRNTYYEAEKMAKHPYIQINGQEYEQATLSGLLPSPFRTALPVTNISVPATYPTYTLQQGGISGISYHGSLPIPSTISVPGFTIPGTLANTANSGTLVQRGYPWTAGFNMNPSSY